MEIATLITASGGLVISALGLVVNIIQSIKENHFESACCGNCWWVRADTEMATTNSSDSLRK